jgi:iron complex outermembrane receptor protein
MKTSILRGTNMIRAAALAGTALAGLGGTALQAQNVTQSGDRDASVIQDIIVTAERRATNLQSTPLSIVAVTQEAIEARGIQDLQSLGQFTPNLSITATRGTGNGAASFTIRGVSGGGGATGERGVGLYVDGIYMPRTSGSVLRVLDIDRIEVLRGPQGTLFGRNSTGGAIRIFSKQPTNAFEGSLEATVGNFDHTDVIGMLNVPLGENFAVRVQGAYLNKEGYVTRGTQKLGAERDYIGRAQLRGELSPGLTVTAGFLYNRSEANATPFVVDEFDLQPGIDNFQSQPGVFTTIQGNYGGWLNDAFKLAGQAPVAPLNDSRVVKGNYAAPDLCFLDDFNPDYDDACNQINNDNYWQADLRIDWELSDAVSLHSVSGLSKLKHRAQSDQQLLGFERRYENIDSKVFYQELQLNAGLFGDAVDLVVGGTYFRERSAAPYNFQINRRGTANYPSTRGTPANSDGGLYTRTITDVMQISESWGAFGSATWHIAEGLNLTGGLRHAWDHKDYTQTRYPPPATPYQAPDFVVAPGTTSTTVHAASPFRALDYRATLDYHFTDDIMGYATISKAYKAGSYSVTVQSYTAANNFLTGAQQSAITEPIPNEKVLNYEAGVRATLFDRRVRFNPTLFLMHWSNRQSSVRVTCGTGALSHLTPGGPGCPVGFLPLLQNQGDAWIRGLELDTQILVGGGLTLEGSLGLTRYKLKNGPATNVYLNPDIPKTSFTVGGSYAVDAGVGRVTMNMNYAYVGKFSVYPDNSADSGHVLPAYGVVNSRLQLAPHDFPVTLTVYANNLLNTVYATFAQRFGGGFWDAGAPTGLAAPPRSMLSSLRGRPREVGLTVKYNF